jgi:hypothetical protein
MQAKDMLQNTDQPTVIVPKNKGSLRRDCSLEEAGQSNVRQGVGKGPTSVVGNSTIWS